MAYFSFLDLLLAFLYIIVLFFIGRGTAAQHADEEHYSFYLKGLVCKLFGGLFFALVYTLYYDGGDTTSYFRGADVLWNLMFKNFGVFCHFMKGDMSPELFSVFDRSTGYPPFSHDFSSFSVCRFTFPFYLLGLKSFYSTTIVISYFSFLVLWKFYEFLISEIKLSYKYTGWALFYVPSAILWCSGIMKDTFCYIAMLMIFVIANRIIFYRKQLFSNFCKLLFWIYIMVTIRSYFFYLIVVCIMIWVLFGYLQKIPNLFIKIIALPSLLLLAVGISVIAIKYSSELFGGKYTVDNLLNQAWIIQDDLTRDYYGENSFDIGDFDPTIQGVMSKFPIAVFSGLFRPFLWESRSVMMIFSGLENTFLFVFSVFVIFKIGIVNIFKFTFLQPFTLACLVFALMFAFMCGLTTANFGALVRYVVPAKTFFVITLLLWLNDYNFQTDENNA